MFFLNFGSVGIRFSCGSFWFLNGSFWFPNGSFWFPNGSFCRSFWFFKTFGFVRLDSVQEKPKRTKSNHFEFVLFGRRFVSVFLANRAFSLYFFTYFRQRIIGKAQRLRLRESGNVFSACPLLIFGPSDEQMTEILQLQSSRTFYILISIMKTYNRKNWNLDRNFELCRIRERTKSESET